VRSITAAKGYVFTGTRRTSAAWFLAASLGFLTRGVSEVRDTAHLAPGTPNALRRRMRLLLACLLVMTAVACGRGGPDDPFDTHQSLTTTVTTSSTLVGRWAFGPLVIHGLPGPQDTREKAGAPYAVLRLESGGSFELEFGAGCLMEGISGTWVPWPGGGLLSMQPDPHQGRTWTDGEGGHPMPSALHAALDGDELLLIGVDERGQPIEQRWRRY
jgi:hypothetical protein